jgi:formate dehydrogenase iron-sulfur subunit
MEVIDKIIQDRNRKANLHLLRDLCDIMLHGSLCGLGGLIPNPVLSALKHFPGDFGIEDVGKLGLALS